jgi:4-hydroxy-tetrahydrodipicolinate reductase
VTRVVVTGVGGRMGSTLVRLLSADAAWTLAGVTSRGAQEDAAVGAPIFATLRDALASATPQVVIDFTSPAASVGHAELCAKARVAMVIGTTGFTEADRTQLAGLAREAPLVVAPNTSVGVNVVIQMAARLAKTLGQAYDVDVLEAHHRLKKDAPSGTALKLAEEIAQARGQDTSVFRAERHGSIGERPRGEIGLQTLRGGDVVGEHTVYFFGDGERIELTHRATSRDQFGRGAIRAAGWVVGRAPGLYSMADVLGLAD